MAVTNKLSRTWSRFAAIALLLLHHTPMAWAQPDHEKCFAALKVADENGNGHLSHHEYIQFLNVLSDNLRYFESYSDLPDSLHLNFQIFQESDGVIDIRGATLGTESTYQQQRLVETMCTTTPITLDTLPTIAPQIANITATNQTNVTATNITFSLFAPSHPNVTSANQTNITFAPSHPNTTSVNQANTTFAPLHSNATGVNQTNTTFAPPDSNAASVNQTNISSPLLAPPNPKQGVFVYPFVPDQEGGPANTSAMSKDGSNVAEDESSSGIPPAFNQTIYSENVVTEATTESDPASNIVSSATVSRNETSTEDPGRGDSTLATEQPVTSDPLASSESTADTEAPTTITSTPTAQVTTATTAPTTVPTTAATTIAPTAIASTAAPTAAPTQANTAVPTSATTPPEATENITAASVLSDSSSTTPVTQAPSEAPTTISPTSISSTANPANETVDSSTTTLTSEPTATSPIDITQSPTESSSEEVLPSNNETIAPSLQQTQEQNDTVGTASNETLSPTDDLYSDCKTVMQFSDINGDGTMNKVEFVWFLNDNWNNLYSGAAYKNLPKVLKDTFSNLATKGEIDISAMNSEEQMTSEEEAFLNKICADTDAAISQDDDKPDEGTEEEGASMATFKDCLEKAPLFDANSDSLIDVNEYSALIGELSEGLLGTRGFASLPQGLQNTFNGLGNGDTLDLRGATKRMKRSSSSQQEVLEEICVDVSYALNEALKDYEPIQEDADTESMLEYGECFMGMELYDVNQDSALDKDEYVGLVNRLGEDMFNGLDFEELQDVLQDNFFNLETNGTINITGFKTDQVRDKEQSAFLAMVCTSTTEAVRAVLDFTEPTSGPSGEVEVDVAADGDPIVIHSSFMLYSDVFIPDEELETGETRRSLEEAYRLFAEEVVNGLVQDAGSTRQRKLEEDQSDPQPSVVFDPSSPIITKFVDLNCMASTKDAICKTVYAQYEIIPAESMDRDAMYEEYVRVTQTHIDAGVLQKDLEQIDPSSLIAIIGASEPVIFSPPESTTAPMDVPFYEGPEETEVESSESSGTSTKKKIMAFITVAVGLLLFVSVVALIYLQYRKRLEDSNASTSSSSQGRSTKSKSPSETGDIHTILDEVATVSGGEAVTINDDEFNPEGSRGSSNGSHGSRKMNDNSFRAGRHSHSDDEDEELGKMQLIDLSQADSYGATDFGASNNAHNVPPLRRKKSSKKAGYNDGDDDERELCSPMSEEMSFAFRRFELEGAGAKTEDSEDLYAI